MREGTANKVEISSTPYVDVEHSQYASFVTVQVEKRNCS